MLGVISRKLWTEEEDEILRKYYEKEGFKIIKRLPGRTKDACQQRATLLGLKYDKTWSPEEDEILRKYYPIEGSEVYKRLPGRSKTACQNRAFKLGIKYIGPEQ